MRKYCLTVDLVDDPALIAEYEQYHRKVWPAILGSIVSSGIHQMEIFRLGNRLFMIMEVTASFSFEKKSAMDAGNQTVQQWEALMWKYQQALPMAKAGEKWILMDKIFDLREQVTG